MTQEELDNNVIVKLIDDVFYLKNELRLVNEQLVQIRKENQLLRTQLNNLTKSHHHQSQSMY